MGSSRHPLIRWLFVLGAVGLAGVTPVATAQEEEDPLPGAAPADGQATMTREQFHQWIDQSAFGGADGVQGAQTNLENLLSLKIDHLGRACGLTTIQKKKLQLAGRGDIKRFFDRVAVERRKYDAIKHDPQAFEKVQTEIQKLNNFFGRPMFDQGSLFAKTLARVVSADQSDMIETAARHARSFRHRAKVDLVVQSVDIVAGLTELQREKLTELLLRETRPARNSFVDFDAEIVLAQTSLLPEAKVRPIFDRDQWQAVRPVLQMLKNSYQATLDGIPLAPREEQPPQPAAAVRDPEASENKSSHSHGNTR